MLYVCVSWFALNAVCSHIGVLGLAAGVAAGVAAGFVATGVMGGGRFTAPGPGRGDLIGAAAAGGAAAAASAACDTAEA